jgi:hypothetical protein
MLFYTTNSIDGGTRACAKCGKIKPYTIGTYFGGVEEGHVEICEECLFRSVLGPNFKVPTRDVPSTPIEP